MKSLRNSIAFLLILSSSSCKVFTEANEFKGAFKLDLTAPISWIPGVDYLLPELVLNISGGFEWDNYQARHKREMEKMSLEKEMLEIKAKKEESTYEAFMRHFNASNPASPNVVRGVSGDSDSTGN